MWKSIKIMSISLKFICLKKEKFTGLQVMNFGLAFSYLVMDLFLEVLHEYSFNNFLWI